jgi:hypothetical protein
VKTVYRVLGIAVFTIESDESPAPPALTASDCAGEVASTALEVGFVRDLARPEYDE